MKKATFKMMVSKLTALVLAAAMLFGVAFVSTEAKACDDYERRTCVVCVSDGYLALRSEAASDFRNEIGSLYAGETVYLYGPVNQNFSYAYSPKLEKYGYVNHNYVMLESKQEQGTYYTVKVDSGYLALRNAKAFDYRNEVGQLYTGNYVLAMDTSDSTYWFVYAPELGQYGYVNCNYLQ